MEQDTRGHLHSFIDKGDFYLCECGKRKLKLIETDIPDIKVGIKSNGVSFSVRNNRDRYFYPEEWLKFYSVLHESKKPLFDFLIQTGSRIDECLYIRPMDFDFDRNTVRIWKTKTKAKLNERAGKPRTILLSDAFVKRTRRLINSQRLEETGTDFLYRNSNESNAWNTQVSALRLFKRKLQVAEIQDWYNFSLHNIRKTHGNWLKALGVPAEEICLRLGHDFNTYLKHYGSPSVFSNQDIMLINKILEGLYVQQRRF